jgi:hypothetical protein
MAQSNCGRPQPRPRKVTGRDRPRRPAEHPADDIDGDLRVDGLPDAGADERS